MTALSLATPQIDPTAGPAGASAAELARRGQIHATAQKFEASFLTSMLQTMFQGVTTAPPFGGGPGEDMWKSFLAEAMAKDMARRGGVGVASSVEREMLKLQGLSETAPSSPSAAAQAGGAAQAGAAQAGVGQAGVGQAGVGSTKTAAAAAPTYPGLAAPAQKVVAALPRWPSVAAAPGGPKLRASQPVTVQ
jgi:peptidoglycan hydrolase FlgJ